MKVSEPLGSIAVVCGLLTAGIQIVDLLLPPRATTAIRTAFERAWLWLSEQRPERLLRYLQNPVLVRRCFFGVSLVALGYMGYQFFIEATDDIPILMPEAQFIYVTCILGFAIAFGLFALSIYLSVPTQLAAWLTAKGTPPSTLIRTAAVLGSPNQDATPLALAQCRIPHRQLTTQGECHPCAH